MNDRALSLLLQACREAGALQLFVLFSELETLAGSRAFTAAEACAHALIPGNHRLRAAIEAVCGEVSGRKLGKTLAKWEGQNVACLRADCVGDDPAGILWIVSATKPIPAPTTTAPDGSMAALPR